MNKEQQTVLHYKLPPAKAEAAIQALHSGSKMEVRGKFAFDEIESIYNLEQKFPELKTLPDNNAKRAYLEKIRSDRASEMKKLNKEIEDLEWRRKLNSSLFDWCQDSGIKIERPDGPSFRKMRKAVAEEKAFTSVKTLKVKPQPPILKRKSFGSSKLS